ncbi:hypothetical protein N7532_000916 [Penicillium argentinense]|uniref:Integrase catalytic domain-containing protein n=1 Tax=Penicillium argentinense TaxID=1131581 RepID=A0A9W9G1H7_9EURO|nr:uncharacterized protein N7532_000916 [Penicillium argentinense]KAJ5110381.1 hypothetical protein N7532_000916 [Penicillium argentinense]
MIHSDIVEMPITQGGSRCLIIFTDDDPRGPWAYAMRWKQDAPQNFGHTYAWVHRQFGAQITRFLGDNGRESSPGVEFDTSPPYCKGQNYRAERRNRTIRES